MTEKKTLLQKIKDFEDRFNIAKNNPDYIDKRIFWAAIILAATLAVIAMGTNEWNLERAYISCPNSSLTSCLNPLWTCNNENTSIETVKEQYYHLEKIFNTSDLTKDEEQKITKTLNTPIYEPGCNPEPINKQHKQICEEGGCKKFLQPGESYGSEPNFLGQNIGTAYWLIFILAFFVNHAMYNKKQMKK
jgi:hypothetical protein